MDEVKIIISLFLLLSSNRCKYYNLLVFNEFISQIKQQRSKRAPLLFYSDINICVTGEENNVKAELARTELELLDLLEENGLENFDAFHGEQTLSDPQILDIIMFVLNDLDSEGKIYCKCDKAEYDSDSEERYEAEVLPEGIKVTCKKCGAQKIIPSNSLINAHEFLNAESLTLE